MGVYEHRWQELINRTLAAGSVVQHTEINGVHRAWVYTGEKVVGPIESTSWDQEAIDEVVSLAMSQSDEEMEFETEDGGVV